LFVFFGTRLPINITMEQAEKRARLLVLLHASSDQASSSAIRVFLAFHPEKASLSFPQLQKGPALASDQIVIELASNHGAWLLT
jgi:hypothetical protein